jgi:hypothetical protein
VAFWEVFLLGMRDNGGKAKRGWGASLVAISWERIGFMSIDNGDERSLPEVFVYKSD